MVRPPRNIKKDRLVNPSLFVYSYFIAGLIETVFCLIAYLWVYWNAGINTNDLLFTSQTNFFYSSGSNTEFFSNGNAYSAETQSILLGESRSSYYVTLIFSQAVHIFNCKSIRTSLFRVKILQNCSTIYGVLIAIAVGLSFTYIPPFQTFLQTNSPPWFVWIPWIGSAIFLTLYNEWRKSRMRLPSSCNSDRLKRIFLW